MPNRRIPALLLIAGAAFAPSAQPAFAEAVSPQQQGLQSQSLAPLPDSPEAVRALGPEGLRRFMELHASEISSAKSHASMNGKATPDERRLFDTIDHIAAQKDAAWSGLYWYTDLDAAKQAATAQHKPILSLRLLGRLDETFSCANSRLFRAVLYANSDVSRLLRDRFILHWSSERPVPLVTIDYGDGRKLVRTLTGNSIHYVLAPDGSVVDVIPGLCGPRAFSAQLSAAEAFAESLASTDPSSAGAARLRYCNDQLSAANALRLSIGMLPIAPRKLDAPAAPGAVPAAQAAVRVVSKSSMERPMLMAVTGTTAKPDVDWKSLASAVGLRETFDLDSRELMEFHWPAIRWERNGVGLSDGTGIGAALNQDLTADTLLSRASLRPTILAWLIADPALAADWPRLNQRVYAEAFLTPASDPWLGLSNNTVYDGLPRSESVRER